MSTLDAHVAIPHTLESNRTVTCFTVDDANILQGIVLIIHPTSVMS